MSDEIDIVLVDDHPIFRKGLRQVIEEENGLRVVAETGDGIEALEQIIKLEPQVALIDILMEPLNGFDLTRQIQQAGIDTNIIFLTGDPREETFRAAMNQGILGYLSKQGAFTEVGDSIKAVLAGQPYVSAALSHYLVNRFHRAANLTNKIPGLSDLTQTELKILRLIAEGLTSREIGKILKIHWRTVDNHRTNISHKLELQGPHALLKFAMEHKNDLP
jgi:DNA-binding NarL/FixJ family response regulator